jgi:peptidoglycan hydrolase CwlO-like protein
MYLTSQDVTILIAVLGLGISVWKIVKQSTKEMVIVSTKVDMVLNSINSIDNKMDNHENKINDLEIKVTEAMASAKSAHNRIDEIIGGVK